MEKNTKIINEFFTAYELHFNNAISGKQADMGVIQNSFAECFLESTPTGATCSKNDDQFLNKINQGFDFYKNHGAQGMKIRSNKIEMLDDFHALVKVVWRYAYLEKQNAGIIDFNTFYLVRSVNEEVKILAYIAGDEQKAIEERGLMEKANPTHERELVSTEEL